MNAAACRLVYLPPNHKSKSNPFTLSSYWGNALRCLSEARRRPPIGPTEGGLQALAAVLSYVTAVRDIPPRELGQLLAEKVKPGAEELLMNTLDRVRNEGLHQGRMEILIRQLTVKFGPLSSAALDRLQVDDVEQLDAWAERLLTAESLGEVIPEG